MHNELLDAVAEVLREQLSEYYHLCVMCVPSYISVWHLGDSISMLTIENDYICCVLLGGQGRFEVALANPDCFKLICEVIDLQAKKLEVLRDKKLWRIGYA